jgi:homoprotocatechuate degradation regulator HpaR
MLTFDQSLPMILNRALDSIMPPYRDLFARYDLTEQQWRVLRVVWSSDKYKSVDLAGHTLLAPASLVGVLDRLQKKGLVERVRSTTDRRAVYIVATAKSRELEKEVSPQVMAIHERLRATITDEEWQTMEAILDKFAGFSAGDDDSTSDNKPDLAAAPGR